MTMINTKHDNMVDLFIYKLVLSFMKKKNHMRVLCLVSANIKDSKQVFTDHDPFITLLVLICGTEYTLCLESEVAYMKSLS